MPLPRIDPPLLNSANPWCSSLSDLRALYESPHTGAVTTRTSLLQGFNHDPAINQHIFFNPQDYSLSSVDASAKSTDTTSPTATKTASLNTLGYSPYPLSTYLSHIGTLTTSNGPTTIKKPFIISVTGSPSDILTCYNQIAAHQSLIPVPLCMEINLSCPNIPSKPPPAYSGPALLEYLRILLSTRLRADKIPIGIKTPPYTYHDQFATLIRTLVSAAQEGGTCPIDFVTATNTLGSCLLLQEDFAPALGSLSGEGIGGMAGPPLHALALGNVRTLRRMLDEVEVLREVEIIGVGGVGDAAGFERMRGVGAKVVAVGTALGREGVDVFGRILGA